MGKKKNSKKNSEIKKEILKDEEKWYGLEKKFWTVVEFGVYLILFTFTCIAIGSQYQYLKSSKEAPIIDTDSKNLIVDDLYSSFSYKVDNICIDTLCDAELTAVYKGDDIKVHYSNQEDNTILTIGGAYSIDKPYRLLYGYNWFKDEQLTNDEMNNIFNKIKDKHFDIVLTHTCPYKYEPKEVFIEGLDQSKVDKSMEHFLDKVEENITYNKWYCGHYHTCKQVDNIEFMFQDIKELQLYTKDDTLVYKK